MTGGQLIFVGVSMAGVAAGVTITAIVAIGWLADRLEARKARHDPSQYAADGDCFPHPVVDRVRPESAFSDVTITKFAPVHGRAFRTAPTAGQRETIVAFPGVAKE